MSVLANLIQSKAEYWTSEEKDNAQSLIGNLIKYVEKTNKLREPQRKSIEVYLWLKFVGQNKRLAEIVKDGLLYNEEVAQEYPAIGDNPVINFLMQFANENELKKLQGEILKDTQGLKTDWNQVLEDLLHNFDYSNYLFSLPMGAGKTFLMASFIYLDLYFANLFKNDKRFAHNFVVFAPSASKTAILPSLQTIKNFNPEWILPKEQALQLKQTIQIEILDALGSKRRDKLQGKNPNLEKVNRLTQTKDFGLVFITNAEKVVLEKYSDEDKHLVDPTSMFYDEKKASEIVKLNELREKLSQIPSLTVILDEVHHAYKGNQEEEKKLRQAVGVLNQHEHIVSVLGLSGTPYVPNEVKVGDNKIKLNQISDIVYNYSLASGIGNFLKVPDIRKAELSEDTFINQVLSDFFNNFDIEYKNGTKSKIAFYCPTVEKLNENIYPFVLDWYRKNRKGKEDAEILIYYSTAKDKKYAIPKENLALFNNLDKPYSTKRIVLLVAVGTEGWDCKSLTGVALPRKDTSKNFVLQTTCRCLREVDDAKSEKALIYLNEGNYGILDSQLKENYRLSIADLKTVGGSNIAVQIRKPRLGKLKYKQIKTNYKVIKKTVLDYKDTLNGFNFEEVKNKYDYSDVIAKGTIGKEGLIKESYVDLDKQADLADFNLYDFIYEISEATYSRISEMELWQNYQKEIESIFNKIVENSDWIARNPNIKLKDIIQYVASFLTSEVKYEMQTIEDNAEIELLEWTKENPELPLFSGTGSIYKMMPRIIDDKKSASMFQKHPEHLEDYIADEDVHDISYNFAPYKMDSDFERNALEEMLKMTELKNLELYFNGYKDTYLQSFWIQTPRGVYTPDFLVIKRKGMKKYEKGTANSEIEKVLILETKGGTYYNDEFKEKEKFVKEIFIKHNPNFKYECFIDDGGNVFNTNRFRKVLTEL